MKYKKIILICAIFFVASNIYAQMFHDAAAYELKGKVKQCQRDIFGDGDWEVLNFERNGKLVCSEILQRNSAGYLEISATEDIGYLYTYNNSGMLIEFEIITRGKSGKFQNYMTSKYIYDSNNRISSELIYQDNKLVGKGTYQYIKIDNKGNWTERIFNNSSVDGKYNVKVRQKRIITYW